MTYCPVNDCQTSTHYELTIDQVTHTRTHPYPNRICLSQGSLLLLLAHALLQGFPQRERISMSGQFTIQYIFHDPEACGHLEMIGDDSPWKHSPWFFSEVTVRSRSFTQNYETEPLWDHFPHWPSSIHHLWWVPCEADEHFALGKIGHTPQDQDPGAQALNKTAAHIGWSYLSTSKAAVVQYITAAIDVNA